MNIVIAVSRYVLPLIALVVLIKCMLALLFGHPKEKTYGYIYDSEICETYPLNMWETSIGRSNSCDIVISYDETVSRFHTVISRRIDGWYIYDLRSKSGVFVNGKRIDKKAMIFSGDVLKFGMVEAVFEVANDPVRLVGKKRKKAKEQPLSKKRAVSPVVNFVDDDDDDDFLPPTDRSAKNGVEAELYIDSDGISGYGYYDDEHRPTLKFKKSESSLFTAMPSKNVKDVYSNLPDPSFDEDYAFSRRSGVAMKPVLYDADSNESFVLSGNYVSIGSSRTSDIVLDSPAVSRKHAELVLYEDGWAVNDCGSRSGTYLSGKRVTCPQLLFDEDVIIFGDKKLYYYLMP